MQTGQLSRASGGAQTGATTFVNLLRERAQQQPEQEAFSFLDHDENEAERLDYAELERRARAIAATLQAHGLEGERALLVFPPGPECVAGLYGCLLAGLVAVPVPQPDPGREWAAPRIQLVARDARPRVILTTQAFAPAVDEILGPIGMVGAEGALVVVTDGEAIARADDWRDPAVAAEDLALLQYTSGSTAPPRGVMVSHGNLIDNCDLVAEAFGLRPDDDRRGLLWLPPYHDMGLIGGLLSPVHMACPVTLMSPITFLVNPIAWPRAISRYRVATSGGPDFAFEMCIRRTSAEERAQLDLSCWTIAFNGAELVRRETMDAFAEAFADAGFSRDAFYPCYGLAESTLIVTASDRLAPPTFRAAEPGALEEGRFAPAGDGAPAAKWLTGCGRPARGVELLIVDRETREPCPDGEVGEIWTRGASVAAGYWAREEESEAAFGAALADGDGPFLRTGDLGFVLDGHLYVTGRTTEVLVLGGRAYYPTDVEWACQEAVPGLRKGRGAAFAIEAGGELRVAIVNEVRPDADHEAVLAGIRDVAANRLDLEIGAIGLIPAQTLPRTTSGKIQRARTRELFLGGDLDTVARWP